jgi:hypothetical protein
MIKYLFIYACAAVGVSLVVMDYNATESIDMTVDVCVEVISGTVNQISTVQVETFSGTATGGLYSL